MLKHYGNDHGRPGSAEEAKALAAGHVKGRTDWSDSTQAVIGLQVATIVGEYVDRFFDEDHERFETKSVETEIVVDVVNPDTGRATPVFDHASKLDVLAFDRFEGKDVLIEHKSSSDDLTPGSPYWRRLNLDSQVSKYLLSLRQAGLHDVRSCLYDVAGKPGTKPKAVPSADVRKIAESGSFGGLQVSEPTLAAVRERYEANKGAKGGFTGKLHEEELLELYGLRLRGLIRSDPSKWFGRLMLSRTDDELTLYARELWELSADVRKARKSGISPRNCGSCWNFNRPCEFFDVCTGTVDVEDRSLFTREGSVHVELSTEFPDRGKNIITNSRLSTFLTCREKHRLRFEEGFRPVGRSDSEALWWGSLFHEALEIVWSSHKAPQKGEK